MAAVWERLTFSRLGAQLSRRARGGAPLQPQELPPPPAFASAAYNAARVFPAWDGELARPGAPSVVRALRVSGALTRFLCAAPLKFLRDACVLATPLVFEQLIAWVAKPEEIAIGLGWVAALFFLNFFGDAVLQPQVASLCADTGVRVSRSLALLLQRKTLRLDTSCRDSTGKLISLLTVDCNNLGPEFFLWLHLTWSGTLQVGFGLWLLYRLLGPPAYAGVAVLLAGSLLQGGLIWMLDFCIDKKQEWSDSRLQLISEALNVIRQLKLGGLSSLFRQRIEKLREGQMRWSMKAHTVDGVAWSLWELLQPLTVFAVFAVSLASSTALTAEVIFSTAALLEIICLPLLHIPEVFWGMALAHVSVKRLEEFLKLPEAGRRVMDERPSQRERRAAALRGGTFSWRKKGGNGDVVLRDLEVYIPTGKLTVIAGPVGSGKSSIITALLGEMEWLTGDIAGAMRPVLNGDVVAYAPQEPFIFDATLRENIVHFAPLDGFRYQRVLRACALEKDMDEFPEGDATMLGSRGYRLSGGQRARVALARAVYLEADVYIADMTLSALDAEVAREVFDAVFGNSGILSSRTRIMVSHSDVLCKRADHVIRLDSSGTLTTRLLAESHLPTKGQNEIASGNVHCGDKEVVEWFKLATPLVNEEMEHAALGAEQSARWYMCFSGIVVPLCVGILVVLSQLAVISLDIFLAHLSRAAGSPSESREYLIVLLVLAGCVLSLSLAKQLLGMWQSVRIASDMHRAMLSSLFTATTSFYDTVPVASMVNRFAGDTNQLDWLLPTHLINWVTIMSLLALMTSFALIIAPLAIVVLLPAIAYYYGLTKRFCVGIRDLSSITSASESPLLSCFQESTDVSGALVLRAGSLESAQMSKFMNKLDAHSRGYVLRENYVNRHLEVRASAAGAVTIAGVGLASVLSVERLSPGLVGLTLLWSFKMTLPLSWLPSILGIMETALVSCERIRTYIVSLPREGAEFKQCDYRLEKEGWPSRGEVVIKDAGMRYRPELPLALRGLTLVVPAGDRLGIVGRTGAGKSSILAALLRSTELCDGSIFIDNVNVAEVGLDLLRRKVCVLPQAPVLFRGTVRDNCDPRSLCSDAEIWNAVRHSQATSCVEALGGLDGEIEDCGANISPGERQLVALARVLCRHRSSDSFSLLILDESSSQIDKECDKKLQRAIDEWLKGVTMIVIAHRLETVLRCDQVCVIEDGAVLEGPGSPKEMMSEDGSQFRLLAKELGLVESSP